MSEEDLAVVEQMIRDEGFTSFQALVEHRLFGRRVVRPPGPARDQPQLEDIKSA